MFGTLHVHFVLPEFENLMTSHFKNTVHTFLYRNISSHFWILMIFNPNGIESKQSLNSKFHQYIPVRYPNVFIFPFKRSKSREPRLRNQQFVLISTSPFSWNTTTVFFVHCLCLWNGLFHSHLFVTILTLIKTKQGQRTVSFVKERSAHKPTWLV